MEWEPRADCVDFEPQWKNDGKEELEGLDSRALMADATTLINLSWSALHCREEALPQPTKKKSSTESDVLSDQGHRTARPSYCAYLKARASTFNVQRSTFVFYGGSRGFRRLISPFISKAHRVRQSVCSHSSTSTAAVVSKLMMFGRCITARSAVCSTC